MPSDPHHDTATRTTSIVEPVLSSVSITARVALAERTLRRALELTNASAPLDATTAATLLAVLARARSARLLAPQEQPQPPLTTKPATNPAHAALVGSALALLQAISAASNPDAPGSSASVTTAARRCVERALPLLIPRLIDAWAALRADARKLNNHTGPVSDETLGPLW